MAVAAGLLTPAVPLQNLHSRSRRRSQLLSYDGKSFHAAKPWSCTVVPDRPLFEGWPELGEEEQEAFEMDQCIMLPIQGPLLQPGSSPNIKKYMEIL